KKILTTGGAFVSVKGNPKKSKGALQLLKEIIDAGKLKSVIDRTYTLEQIRDAHAYVEGFHKKGNVVVKVEY
nr:zinc-binding dehydrogenase [Ferruginibacter sp.]